MYIQNYQNGTLIVSLYRKTYQKASIVKNFLFSKCEFGTLELEPYQSDNGHYFPTAHQFLRADRRSALTSFTPFSPFQQQSLISSRLSFLQALARILLSSWRRR